MSRNQSSVAIDQWVTLEAADANEEEGPTSDGEDAAAVASTRMAILLVDFQNEFAKKGGKLHELVSEVMEVTDMLRNVIALVDIARKMGCIIIHSPVVMEGSEALRSSRGDPKHKKDFFKQVGFFTENTWNCDFIHELEPMADDFILTDRNDFNAFSGTKLDTIIKSNNIKHLFIAGFITDVCITDTARAASRIAPDVSTYVLADGCAASSGTHHAALADTIPQYAKVINCDTAQSEISKVSAKAHGVRDDWLLVEKMFAASGVGQDGSLEIDDLLSLIQNAVSNSGLYSIVAESIKKKNTKGRVSRKELHEILFERKPRKTRMEKTPIFIIMWILPFLYSFSTRLPFIFLALEVQTKERGGSLWEVGVLLGSYQTCRAIANFLIFGIGGNDPFKHLEIILVFFGLFGWLFSALYSSSNVWALLALCGVGLSETIVNLQRSLVIETEKESPGGFVDEIILGNRLRLQYIAVSLGSSAAYILGGMAYTQKGFQVTCWLGVFAHAGQLIGAFVFLGLMSMGKKRAMGRNLDSHDVFRSAIYQLQAAFVIISQADDVGRGASNALTFQTPGLSMATKMAKGDHILSNSLRDMYHASFNNKSDSVTSIENLLGKIRTSRMVGLKDEGKSKRPSSVAVDNRKVAKLLDFLMKSRGEMNLSENEFVSYWSPLVYLSMYGSAQESAITIVWPYMKVIVFTQAVMALSIGTFLSTALLSYTVRFNMEAERIGLLLGIGEFLGMLLIILTKLLPPLLSKIKKCNQHSTPNSSTPGILAVIMSRPLHVPFILLLLSTATISFTIPHLAVAIFFQMIMSSLNDLSVTLLNELIGTSLPADQFKYYQGIGQWLRRLGNMITGIAGPILFGVNQNLPFILFGFIVFVWSIVVWVLLNFHAEKVEQGIKKYAGDQKDQQDGGCASGPLFAPFVATAKTPWHVLEHQYYSLNKEEIDEELMPNKKAQADISILDYRIRCMGAALKVEQSQRRAMEDRIHQL